MESLLRVRSAVNALLEIARASKWVLYSRKLVQALHLHPKAHQELVRGRSGTGNCSDIRSGHRYVSTFAERRCLLRVITFVECANITAEKFLKTLFIVSDARIVDRPPQKGEVWEWSYTDTIGIKLVKLIGIRRLIFENRT